MKDKLDHGISCNFCHAVEYVSLEKGADGRYDTRIFNSVALDESSAKHGPRKDAKSPVHPATFNLVIQDSKLCGTCHLNQENFSRLPPTRTGRAFGSGKTKETCQTCHMPKHKVPGSEPIRNVILKIDAWDQDGNPLTFVGPQSGKQHPLAGMGSGAMEQSHAWQTRAAGSEAGSTAIR